MMRKLMAYALPQEALHLWELPVAHMPGPEEQANRYYRWGHGTSAEGLVGILTLGRVLRSSLEAVGSSQSDEVLSFYGKASQDAHYEPSKLEFVSKLHHSTKNSARVVVSSTVHEGHLCKFHALVHSPSGDHQRGSRQNRPDLGPLQHPPCTDCNEYCSRSFNPQACHI